MMAEDGRTTIDRRSFLHLVGVGGAALAAGPTLWRQPGVAGSPHVEQLHLQFGDDAAREMIVSWATAASVAAPRVRYGTAAGGLGSQVQAETRTYIDHVSGREVVTHHAALRGLHPATDYVYEAVHTAGARARGTFRTAPDGRAPFRFTSFGDQGVAGREVGSDASAIVVGHVEEQRPLLHLLNGDLAYANVAADPASGWDAWFRQNQRSARSRPWMPAAGNHEQEIGNGATGFKSFTTRFFVPDNGLGDLAGHFYAFTVGSVRFVMLQNDDVCYQFASNEYVRGYSGGAQKRWLDQTLSAARADPRIDWVVVCMHQLAMSSSASPIANGADLGVREEFVPLFDRYAVDLVLCGHDHCFERTYAVRGVEPDSPTLQPRVTEHSTNVVDSTKGTVHMTLGGGGAIPMAKFGPRGGPARVIVAKGDNHRGEAEYEPASWSAVTDHDHAFGFAAFDVDPGDPGGPSRIKITHYRIDGAADQSPQAYDRFTLEKPHAAA
jgi:3',5'-cyclic AMP phosphodiesterase CpdA